MTCRLLDGKDLAKRMLAKISDEAAALRARGVVPCIASVQVLGDDASSYYVRNQAKSAAKANVEYRQVELPNDTSADRLGATIDQLNADGSVHGIILQVPLPKPLSGDVFQQRISPAKDVEGVTAGSLGALVRGSDDLVPCTARAAVELVLDAGLPVEGKRVVVLGRSAIVGKPLALMMLARNATVTVCHSKTADLPAVCREADILMTAMGAKAHMVRTDWVKPGAAVVDIAIISTPEGGITGDCDPAIREVAGAMAPVPGGVGPVTVAMLLRNTLIAARRASGG